MTQFKTLLEGGFGNPNADPRLQRILDEGGSASELLARAVSLTYRRVKEGDAVRTSDGREWVRAYYFPLWSGRVAVLLPPDKTKDRSSVHDAEQCLTVLQTQNASADEVHEFKRDLERAIQTAASVVA